MMENGFEIYKESKLRAISFTYSVFLNKVHTKKENKQMMKQN